MIGQGPISSPYAFLLLTKKGIYRQALLCTMFMFRRCKRWTLVGDPDDPVTLRTISCQMPVDLPALRLLNLSWLGFPAGGMFTKALRERIPAVSEMLAI